MDTQDYMVVIVNIQTVPIVDDRGNFINVKRFTVRVGPYGPFMKDFFPGDDTPDHVNAWKSQLKAEVIAYHAPA